MHGGDVEDLIPKHSQEPQAQEVPLHKPPSQQLQEQHNLTHLPHAAWCEVCTKARGKDDAHRSRPKIPGAAADAQELPVICVDYLIGKVTNNPGEPVATLLTAYDRSGTGRGSTTQVSSKGELVHSVKWLCSFLDMLGHDKVALQSDQENSIMAVCRKVVQLRPNTIHRTIPIGSSKSAGPVERWHIEIPNEVL